MKRVLSCLAVLALSAVSTPALAQRTVMVEVCNETGFRVATAAAYRTGPTQDRTLQAWFLVDPGECLDGGLNGVTGESVDLHVMSGEWFWPRGDGDTVWCVSASSSTSLASAEPCTAGRVPRAFRSSPIEITGQRGPGGRNVGRVQWRIACDGLAADDAALCPGAPVDAQGLARPVRTLEVCNLLSRDIEIAVLDAMPDGNFALDGLHTLPAEGCADVYRGFPQTDTLMVAEIGVFHDRQEGQFCLPLPDDGVERMTSDPCAAGEAPVGYRLHGFGERTARYTAYIGR